jgi:hypothetical protein
MKPHLDQALVRELLIYNPATGNLIWRKRDDGPAWWNTKYAGKIAGSIWTSRNCKTSYRRVRILGWDFKAHRVIWLYMTGKWPVDIDHINGDGTNNRWTNLRETTRAQNRANSVASRNNKLGLRGVSFHKPTARFRSRIKVDGKNWHLGLFDTKEEARAAYLAAAVEAWGKFARQA